jgi:hypothetical protein
MIIHKVYICENVSVYYGGIKRVEPVTTNKHDKLTFGSRPIEITVGMFTNRRHSTLVIDGKNNTGDATSMANKMERTTTMLAERC